MKTNEDLQIIMDLLTSQWEEIKRDNPAVNTYELSEAICLLAYVIKEGEQ